jgi:phosphotriesterase-related protein
MIGTASGQVMTVLGPIPADALGITLIHEHVLLDAASKWQAPCCASDKHFAYRPVEIDMIGELRMNPLGNLDNCRLFDPEVAAAELMLFRDLGGRTVVDPTNVGIGRDPQALQRISRRTGLNIVMGCGFYLEPSHPEHIRDLGIDDLTDLIAYDVGGLDRRPPVLAGIIGEIGVSPVFSKAEEKSLRAAARAAARTRVPLSIHLPGWRRYAHRVLDIVAEEGADLRHTVLCHMNPSLDDWEYQTSLAQRGAFLEYDQIGMDFFFADELAQSPADEENAKALKRLIDAGFLDRLLISQDVFLKMMLTRYGGFGYGYILKHFVPRLLRHGVTPEQVDVLLVANPRRVFSDAA